MDPSNNKFMGNKDNVDGLPDRTTNMSYGTILTIILIAGFVYLTSKM
jgi:hypothetical protein